MNLTVLGSPSGWHVQDLIRASASFNCQIQPLPFTSLRAGSDGVKVGASNLAQADAVLVRTMPPGSLEQVVYRMDVLHTLAEQGVPVINPPRAIECAVDKYLSCVRLQQAGLDVPATVACETYDDAMVAFDELGANVVVKPIFGSEGRGIMHVTDVSMMHRTAKALERLNAVLLLQRFVEHPGHDVRVFVLGNTVLAGMKRFATDDFRTNIAQGGRAVWHSPTADESRLALAAARAVGAEVAGVDLMYEGRGEASEDLRCWVLEVNAVPGWRALSKVAPFDVGAKLLDYLCRRVGGCFDDAVPHTEVQDHALD